MPSATTSQPPRTLTPTELSAVVKMFRESRSCSQEQLAEIAGLSTRTVQRAENGQPSDLDTRRALARAFEFEDIDVLNKPFSMDYFHEYRDCHDLYSEVQKLEVHDELQGHIDALAETGVSLRYATRKVTLAVSGSAAPFEASVVYIVSYPTGKEPGQFATPRKFRLG